MNWKVWRASEAVLRRMARSKGALGCWPASVSLSTSTLTMDWASTVSTTRPPKECPMMTKRLALPEALVACMSWDSTSVMRIPATRLAAPWRDQKVRFSRMGTGKLLPRHPM